MNIYVVKEKSSTVILQKNKEMIQMSYVFAIPIIFIIIVAFLEYRIIKEEEIEEIERRKIAEELLLFCKDTHTFWEIKNNLIKIPVQNVGINNLPSINTSSLEEDITYFHLFDIAFDIQKDVNEDSELKIILYYSDNRVIEYLTNKFKEPFLFTNKIGSLSLVNK